MPVSFICCHFNVSRSGYYSWLNRAKSEREKLREERVERVVESFNVNRGRYGSPRVLIDLKKNGYSISENTVAKIMREKGLVARKKRAFKIVTLKEEVSTEIPKRSFMIEDKPNLKINEIWAGDITYLPVDNKFLYLSVVMDLKRRKITGWSLDDRLGSEGVIRALEDSYRREGVAGSIFHSDQGVQYKSLAFKEKLKAIGSKASMSRRGNCYDNAFIESFFKSLKSELLWNQSFRSEAHLRQEIFEYIEYWYNRKRIHSGLGNKSPLEYELEIKVA